MSQTRGSTQLKGRAADALVRVLVERGVDTVFGMCGHGDLTLLDAFVESGIQFVTVHHEQVAVHAADAYYRTSHKPGVVVTTLGPGALNTTTALGDAAADSSAVVVISGAPPSRYVGLGAYQEIDGHGTDDQHLVTRPIVKRSYPVRDHLAIPHTVARAWDDALSGSPGPVHVHVPLDLLGVEDDYQIPPPRPTTGAALSQPEVLAFAERLARAERPVILAGGGAVVSEATEALIAVAERYQAPVVTTMVAQGVIPEDHDLALGFTGVVGTQPANTAIKQADVVLAVGTRFPEMDTSSWRRSSFLDPDSCDLLQIDIDPAEIGRLYPVRLGAVADAATALAQLAEHAPADAGTRTGDWIRELARQRDQWRERIQPTAEHRVAPFQPAAVLGALSAALPADAVLVTGVGVRHLVGQHYPVRSPRGMLVASGFSTMGWETAAAVGAKRAAGRRPVVGVIGDGAFNSTVSAVSTAIAYGLDVLWVVLDNGGYQSIGVYQDRHFGRRLVTDFEHADGSPYQIDYIGLIRAYGGTGEHIDDLDGLGDAVRRWLERGGNHLLHVPTHGKPPANATGHWDVNDIMAGRPDTSPAPLSAKERS
ncbi:MAG TPA: thiamine pyrophosphate-binding protein [Micromonosporaceae bacterium]